MQSLESLKSLLSYLYLRFKRIFLKITVPDQAPNTRYAEAPPPSRYQPEPARYQPEPEPEPFTPPPAPSGGGGRYIALYDYTAADDDEVGHSYFITKTKIRKNQFCYDEARNTQLFLKYSSAPSVMLPRAFVFHLDVCHSV